MLFGGELLGAADVVDVIGIAAVDEDVARFEKRQQIGDRLVDHGGRNHQPDGARLFEFFDEIRERSCADGFVFDRVRSPPSATCRTPRSRVRL